MSYSKEKKFATYNEWHTEQDALLKIALIICAYFVLLCSFRSKYI